MNRSILLLCIALIAFLSHPLFASEEERAPESVEGAVTVTAAEAKHLYDQGVKFIDVRNPRLFARRHVTGAHHLDIKDVYSKETLNAVAQVDEPIIVYCSGLKCTRSSRATAMAVEWGYKKVYYLRGGIVEWRNAGFPMTGTAE